MTKKPTESPSFEQSSSYAISSQTSSSSLGLLDIGEQTIRMVGRMGLDSHIDYWGRAYSMEHISLEHIPFARWKRGLVCCWVDVA
jgi:hypothetical protein